jgi:hypothetical protein
MPYTKDQIKDMLKESICTVTFAKANSDEIRVMPCTLNPEIIPTAPTKNTSARTKKPNQEVLSVWCTDKNAWRSFRIENVIEVTQSS